MSFVHPDIHTHTTSTGEAIAIDQATPLVMQERPFLGQQRTSLSESSPSLCLSGSVLFNLFLPVLVW